MLRTAGVAATAARPSDAKRVADKRETGRASPPSSRACLLTRNQLFPERLLGPRVKFIWPGGPQGIRGAWVSLKRGLECVHNRVVRADAREHEVRCTASRSSPRTKPVAPCSWA